MAPPPQLQVPQEETTTEEDEEFTQEEPTTDEGEELTYEESEPGQEQELEGLDLFLSKAQVDFLVLRREPKNNRSIDGATGASDIAVVDHSPIYLRKNDPLPWVKVTPGISEVDDDNMDTPDTSDAEDTAAVDAGYSGGRRRA